MAVEKYEEIPFRQSRIDLIETVNRILAEYKSQGLVLTVRQIYYQLVSRDHIANTVKEYGMISRLLNDGRMAGLIDWDMIEDRTREFKRRQRWESAEEILTTVAESFHMDLWEGQEVRAFCVVEKDALSGVLEPVCNKYDIPLLAAKGYCSVSVLREFAELDILPAIEEGQTVLIYHLGDHDPSGIDMTRDIRDRMGLFAGEEDIEVIRLALNMDQVEALRPPPNPAKSSDKRFADYFKKYGDKSWELDALRPDYMATLIEEQVTQIIDFDQWDKRLEEIDSIKTRLNKVAEEFED